MASTTDILIIIDGHTEWRTHDTLKPLPLYGVYAFKQLYKTSKLYREVVDRRLENKYNNRPKRNTLNESEQEG